MFEVYFKGNAYENVNSVWYSRTVSNRQTALCRADSAVPLNACAGLDSIAFSLGLITAKKAEATPIRSASPRKITRNSSFVSIF